MSSLILKIVAMLSMIFDHVTTVFPSETAVMIDEIFGRLAFPLYAFMITDSFRHLSGVRLKRFMIILGVMAVISEPAFDRAFYGAWYFPLIQNQLLQFFTYGLAFVCSGLLKASWQKILVWIVTIILNQELHLGYFGGGIILMLMYDRYLEKCMKKKPVVRFGIMTLIMLVAIPILSLSSFMIQFGFSMLFSVSISFIMYCLKVYLPIVLTVPFLALYSGEYGNIPDWFRKAYRYFYPVHLWILTVIVLFQ